MSPDQDERLSQDRLRRASLPAALPPPAPARLCNRRSPLTNVTRGQPTDLEARSSGRHDRALRGELAQRLLVVRLDNREAVRVLVG